MGSFERPKQETPEERGEKALYEKAESIIRDLARDGAWEDEGRLLGEVDKQGKDFGRYLISALQSLAHDLYRNDQDDIGDVRLFIEACHCVGIDSNKIDADEMAAEVAGKLETLATSLAEKLEK